MVSKDYVAKLGKIKHVFREKDLLNEMDHPFIIKLKDTRMVSTSIFNTDLLGLHLPILCI